MSFWRRPAPDDLVEFLRARLAEEEETAKRAAFGWGADWALREDEADGSAYLVAEGSPCAAWSEDSDVIEHCARWDPARVLAEIEAKRAIIDMHRPWGDPLPDGTRDCQICGWRRFGCLTLLALAQPHAGRDDFLPEWRLPVA